MQENKKIILYGAGIRGKRFLAQMNEMGCLISCFVDRDPLKIGTIIQNVPVISVSQLKDVDNYILCITPKEYQGIEEELVNAGIPASSIVSDFGMIASRWIDSRLAGEFLNKKKDAEVETVFFDCENGICLGGVESWCLDIGEGLSKKNYRVRYIAKKLQVQLSEKLERQMDYVRIVSSHMFERTAMEDMIAVIANNVPCTVVACMPDEVMVAACAVKKAAGKKVKIISAIHNDIEDFYKKNLALDTYIDAYVCVSKKIQDEMKKRVSNPEKVYRKVSPISFPKQLNRIYSTEGKPLRLGLAGRIVVQQKRLDLLIPLLIKLKMRGIPFLLELAGDGEYLPEIRREAKRFELDQDIVVHGRLCHDDMHEFWKRQDICLNLSDYEGRSLSVMEAMAAGAVPVLTDTSGNEDIIEGETGFIVELENIDKMADIIENLSKNREKIKNIGDHAHKVIVRECDYDAYIAFIEELVRNQNDSGGQFHA